MSIIYARTKEREDLEGRTERKSIKIYSLWTENISIDENKFPWLA